MHAFWTQWGFPVTALILGAIASLYAWLGARRFDRKYGRNPKRPHAAE